ncbi:MAG TPA: hypothetical protein VER55_05245 [Ardenticatenaceae bacterium]|nr:hypothetical protein [Ardenticatenaceae bacterium]
MPRAAPRLGWAALVLFVTACNRITPPPPAATPTAVLPTATARPTATPQAPDGEPSLLERSTLALIEAGAYQSETVVTYFIDPPQAFPLRVDTSYQIADSEQVHHIAHWPEGLREETICTGSKRWEQCWTRVGTHPWTRAITLEFDPTILEQRRSLEARAVVTATTPLTLTGEILVEWRVPLDETEFIGQSWLKADSLLPVREVSEVREPDGSTRFRGETRFKRYDAAIGVATPVVATVTPAPTIAPTQGTEFKTRVEEAPLPGTLVVPEGEGPFPAAVVLHGSEGGVRYSEPLARRLGQAG